MNGGIEFEPDVIDSAGVTVGSLDPREGDSFEYVFDPGGDWRHRSEVQSVDVPVQGYGARPDTPVPILGLGVDPGSVRPDRRRRVARGFAPSGRNVSRLPGVLAGSPNGFEPVSPP